MKTKVHRIELLVIDHDNLGASRVAVVLEQARYPNHCISPKVKQIDTREVDWTDDHPLNQLTTSDHAYRELFDLPEDR